MFDLQTTGSLEPPVTCAQVLKRKLASLCDRTLGVVVREARLTDGDLRKILDQRTVICIGRESRFGRFCELRRYSFDVLISQLLGQRRVRFASASSVSRSG